MSVNMNNPSERNPLGQFLVPLDVKQKTVVHILRSFKTNFKSSERIVPYVVVFKIGGVLQKSMPVLNKLYIIVFYIIHGFFSTHYRMTDLNFLLVVTLKMNVYP